MSERKRLHPISALYSFFKQLKELIFPFVILFVFGNSGEGGGIWRYIVGGAIILFVLIYGILTWLRFTYRIEEGELRIESGVFIRKKRYIPFERIQSLDFSEGILQRPFGLVKVKVETAGASGLEQAEAVLTAISKNEAKTIQDVLASVKNGSKLENEEVVQNKEIIYRINTNQLLMLASTSGGAGVVISAVLAFIFQFDEMIPYEKVFKEFRHFIANGVAFVSVMVVLVILIAWIAALIGTMLKYAHFTLQKVEEDLVITRGLIEKRQVTIPVNRIQGIRVCENLLRQPFGFASVYIESAGGSIEKEGTARILILPILKKDQIAGILQSYLPDYTFESVLNKVPNRALRRYMFRGLIIPLLVIAICLIFFRPLGYLSLLLLPIALVWAYFKYKDAGWNVSDLQLTLSFRGIIKNTIMIQKNKIQSLSRKESYFQRKQNLASVNAAIKSGIGESGGTVVDLEKEDSLSIYNWYKR